MLSCHKLWWLPCMCQRYCKRYNNNRYIQICVHQFPQIAFICYYLNNVINVQLIQSQALWLLAFIAKWWSYQCYLSTYRGRHVKPDTGAPLPVSVRSAVSLPPLLPAGSPPQRQRGSLTPSCTLRRHSRPPLLNLTHGYSPRVIHGSFRLLSRGLATSWSQSWW